MNIEDWKSQLRRGTVEYSVLMLLDHKACYGYEIIKILNDYSGLAVSENTVYPLLRRLEKDKILSAKWIQNTAGSPPRKYYQTTTQGKEYLSEMMTEWGLLVDSIQKIQQGDIELEND